MTVGAAGSGEYLVAGGGIAGLSAAYRLQRAGHRVRVLEAASRAGSKMCSLSRDGFVLDRAAVFFTPGYDRLLAMAGEIGVTGDVVPAGSVFGLVRDRKIHEVDTRHPLGAIARTSYLTAGGKARAAAALAPEVWRARTVSRARIHESGRYDTETLAEWAGRELPPDLAEYVVGAAIRSMYGAEAGEVSRVELLGLIALLKQPALLGFRGGLQTYADRLAATLDVITEATVLEVVQRSESAEVVWRDVDGREYSESVDGCVVALPATEAAKVRSDLDPWRAGNLTRIRQGEVIMVSIALDRAPAGLGAVFTMLPRTEHSVLTTIVAEHHKGPGRVPHGTGMLTLVLASAWSAEHFHDDDSAIAEVAVAAADQFVPGTADHCEFVVVSRWYQQYPPVGHYAALGDMKTIAHRIDRTVHLAGEYLYAPNLNAATASGEDAAATLLGARS